MPRATALQALERFRRDGAWSGQTLAALSDASGLTPRDRALAARLFYTALQNLTLCDWYIGAYARGRLEPKVRDILRLGVCQLVFMDRIPSRAAVDQSVALCRTLGYGRAAGLVNAVLRRVASDREALPEPPGRGTAAYLHVRYSHPLWLTEELVALRGYDGAEAVLRKNNEIAPIHIYANTLRTTTRALAEELGARRHPTAEGCLTLPGGDVTRTPAFGAGRFYVQDPAARTAALCAGPGPGMRVLDACAAPGGKSFAAAIAMEDRGRVDACDVSGKKLNLVMDGADRMGLTAIRCLERDARDTPEGGYDVVYADVPCSGLGVIRKKPEIRWRDEGGLQALPPLQEELLTCVARAVRPGGVLVYSTCTWRTSENAAVTGRFLRERPDFTKTLERTFWPDLDETDGFYICRMKREESI